MKSAWKWVLLFVGVLVVAFCVSLSLFLRGLMGFGFGRVPMLFHHGGGFPMMGGGGFFGFGLLRCFVPLFALVVLGLLVWGVVWLVRRGNRLAPAVAVAAPAEPMPSSVTVTPVEPVETNPCTNCGQPLQSGWVACPFCGQKV